MLVVPQTIEVWFELAAVETDFGVIGHTLDDIGQTPKELFQFSTLGGPTPADSFIN